MIRRIKADAYECDQIQRHADRKPHIWIPRHRIKIDSVGLAGPLSFPDLAPNRCPKCGKSASGKPRGNPNFSKSLITKESEPKMEEVRA